MAILLSDLFHTSKDIYKLQLIAGKEGLSQSVLWVYLAEDMNEDFLRGGELVITTGIFIHQDPDWILHLVHAVKKCHCCGLILNIGKHLFPEHLTWEILDFCNEAQLPLFLMPWEIHIADLTQDYCNRIFKESQRNDMLTEAIQSLFYSSEHFARHLPLLESHGYHPKDTYHIAVMDVSFPHMDAASFERKLFLITNNYFGNRKTTDFFFSMNQQFLLFLHNHSEEEVGRIIEELSHLYHQTFPEAFWHIGVGSSVQELIQLSTGYSRALAALSYAQYYHLAVAHFSALGIYKILFSVSDRKLLVDYYHEQLGPLLEYDGIHNSDYAKTLYYYIKYGGSIQQVAAKMTCHRNTINYRIKKIRELLPVSIDDNETCFLLYLAYTIQDYLQIPYS